VFDAALLLLRSVTGGLLAGHGSQKLFGAFQGPGREKTAGMMQHLRLEPAGTWGTIAGASELAGGALTALGLGGPVGPVVALAPMTMAATTAHWGKPIWVTHGGAELPVTNLAAFGALALAGPGRLSLDGALGIRVPRWIGAVALAGVAAGCTLALATRRPAQPAVEQAPEQATAEPPIAAGQMTRVEEERELAGAPEQAKRRARAEQPGA
jgi:putative oxidoreductase